MQQQHHVIPTWCHLATQAISDVDQDFRPPCIWELPVHLSHHTTSNMSRPEELAPPEIWYGDDEAQKYTGK